ncbi:MAG: hypothetical protein GWO20_14725 [Candidatus Korarchaeota archaeon]|nr:hypothetical protein [Candidatus Korarchaeota archaeon]
MGGDVQHPDLREGYVAYLSQKLIDNDLLNEDLQHLLDLYNRLQSRDYFSDFRPSTSPALVNDLLGHMNETYESSIAAIVGKVFISHQIAEEWFFRLLKACQFLIDLRMGSYHIGHPDLEKQNLHSMCKSLEMCVDFPSRKDLIQEARQINSIRNRIAHQLLTTESAESLKKLAKQHLNGFTKLRSLMEESYDELNDSIKTFRKWSDMFEDELLALLCLELDDNDIAYKDEHSFAADTGLTL